jgi:hypothetical protein
MNYRKLILFVCAICLFACSKSTEDGTGNGIFIKVENSTSQDFKEVLTNNKSFKNVHSSDVTSYQHFESALSVPTATLITNDNDTIYAGLVYYDWLEYLSNGKYTLKIFEDATTVGGFNCEYIKN